MTTFEAPRVIARRPGLVVLAKPPGLSLLADRSGAPCLWDGLADWLGTAPLLVHRLDKGTSGVLLVATARNRQRELTRAFGERRIRKHYLAWVVGRPLLAGSAAIELALMRGRKARFRVAGRRDAIVRRGNRWLLDGPAPPGKQSHPSLTRLRVLRSTATPEGERTLLALQPVTGRSHQLRVHLSWIGHPILGDTLYGRPNDSAQQAPRLQLHCHRLVVPGLGSFADGDPPDWLL